ncbi:MAG: monooxygenase [Rhodospirillaceae bacterium]|nr:monooxygenase [Rhodospirillaceae bacterium]
MKKNDRVIICGGGPVGMVAALALVKQNIPITLVESFSEPPKDPRAATIHPSTLEMLSDVDLAKMVVKKGLIAPKFQFRDRKTQEIIAVFDMAHLSDETEYPFSVQYEQWKLVRDALNSVKRYDIADIRLGRKAVAFSQDYDGVTLITENVDGELEKIEGKYILACDGGPSTVRLGLGVFMSGFTWGERFLVLTSKHDFEANDGYTIRNYVMDPTEWCAIFKVPGDDEDGIWRTLFPTKADETDTDLLSDAGVSAKVGGLRFDMNHHDILHRNLYTVNQRVADRFTIERIFLAGDAAHLNNPLGGLGLNTGIHDCMNITKKIGDVWYKREKPEIFELYHRQRHQLATEFLQSVSIENKKRIEETDPEVIRTNQKNLRESSEDPVKAKAWLMRSSLLDSVRKEATIE